VLGTLISSVPDLLMPPILGGLRASKTAPRPAAGGPVETLDGQLQFTLPEGVAARDLTEREKKMGFVLALKAPETELMILKVVQDGKSTEAKDQHLVVSQTVLGAPRVKPQTLTPAELFSTPAGPGVVHASAETEDGARARFLAGFMPWGYLGYSILAKGPDPEALLESVFGGVRLGPSALPKIVAATPAMSVPRGFRLRKRKHLLAAAGGAVLVLLLGVWALRPRT
jgi:hypothetical protein